MASTSPSTSNPPRILAKVLMNRHGYDGPDDCITSIRCNGRLFYMDMSPIYICNSPVVESRYRKFIAAVKDEFVSNDQEHEEDVLEDFQNWLIAALEPLFLEVAPDIPPSFDPEKLATGEAHPLLSEYLIFEEYYYRLETENDKVFPILSEDDDKHFAQFSGNEIDPELAEELGQRGVKFIDPSEVEVAFRRPKEALLKEPSRVLVDLDDGSGRKTLCFYKPFRNGGDMVLEDEVEAHLRVLRSNLPPDARVVRLHGVVMVNDLVAGLLLTHIDHGRHTTGPIFEHFILHLPIPLRQRWARQIRETVEQLHEAGLVWGNAKAENVMIDQNDDAWLVDIGVGYTEWWEVKDKAGTKEGDLQGLARIVELLSNEEYEEFEYEYYWDD